MTKFENHQYCNMTGGSSGSRTQTIITNRPEAVVVGPLGPKAYAPRDRHDGSGSWSYDQEFEVEVQEHLLRDGDFVAVRVLHLQDHCGQHRSEELKYLAGRSVASTELDFGSAYAAWAATSAAEALDYLRGLAAEKPRRVQHSLEFAALGGSSGMAAHEERRAAWYAALRGLGLKQSRGLAKIAGSVRTATAKAAVWLGWNPSIPAPSYWEGLPNGVVEITPLAEAAVAA